MEDLDDIWAAQIGQHEAIVKNVHDLLAKLAWYVFVFKSLRNSGNHSISAYYSEVTHRQLTSFYEFL